MPTPFALTGWAFAVPALLWALYASREEEERTTTLGALLAACLFAAQTFHFPVPGGTSGHLVGATLVMILCGLPMGLLVLTSVIVLQAIVFGDGGLFTLGWNLNNMGLASGFVGASLYFMLRKLGAGMFGAACLSAWVGTLVGALCTSLELACAGITPLSVSLPAMLTVQAITGLCEGLVTAGVLTFLTRTRPNMLPQRQDLIWPGALTLALVTATTLMPPTVWGLTAGQYPAFLVLAGLIVATAVVGLILKLGRRKWGP